MRSIVIFSGIIQSWCDSASLINGDRPSSRPDIIILAPDP
jgi:hypothetical protein